MMRPSRVAFATMLVHFWLSIVLGFVNPRLPASLALPRSKKGVLLTAESSSASELDVNEDLGMPVASVKEAPFPTSASVIFQEKSGWGYLIDSFRSSWLGALQGNAKDLKTLMPEGVKWKNPVISDSDEEMMEVFNQFSEFFLEPGLFFFRTELVDEVTAIIRFQLSFWYPTPWRPRIIIPGQVTLRASSADLSTLLSVEEKWDVSLVNIIRQQLFPRFWDAWHAFSSPSPEYPPIRKVGSVDKVSFVEMPETVMLEIKWKGLAQYPGPPLLNIPGFGLFGLLKTSRPNRDPYFTVLPVEVESGKYSSSDGVEIKQSSWLLHVPTSLQEQVIDRIESQEVFYIDKTSLLREDIIKDEESDLELERDYQVGLGK